MILICRCQIQKYEEEEGGSVATDLRFFLQRAAAKKQDGAEIFEWLLGYIH
jgi:hypothetical protein